MHLPRAIRLDHSDLQVLPLACQPGEWAVPGSFAFTEANPETLAPGERLAFATAWLGLGSFGFTTLVEVAEIGEAEFFQAAERLAQHFVARYGAPDLVTALPAARAELDDASSLCDHKLGTLLAIEREMTAEGLRERVRVITPERAQDHARIWSLSED